MPKKIEDIVVPDRRRSIRDIPIPESRRKETGRKDIRNKIQDTKISEESLPPVRTPISRHRRSFRKKIWLVGIITAAVLVFIILSIFNGATLSYAPKSTVLAFENDVYIAHKSGSSGPFYSVVKLSRDKGITAPAGSEQDVSRKASGTIVVYNTSSASQRLIATTRFESAAGKVYRIDKAITVPAKGSVEAIIYADAPGPEYNSAPTDFTVPGLKGSSQFEAVYARSKTPLASGFVGKEKVVKPEDLAKAKAELQAALREELYTEAEAEVPKDFILFRSLSTFSFEDLPQSAGSGANITLNMRGNLYGVMFKRSDLSRFLSQKKLGTGAIEAIEIPNYSSLEITFGSVPPSDLLSSGEVSFKIKGNALAVWLTDEVALKADLAGKHKSEVQSVLKNYLTIASANVTVRPFWKNSLPNEVTKIRITKVSAE
ncbi:MAG: hypothetical protein A2758_02885 [Candidatus Zambryskibacteria bacterium RIFCSPHIGHO2_01_FULL_49_18]|uniref:Baseplate protein J-like domain-containing protein n=2 Tax=Candidatus Zambryskiibacteriota TaxID=1817925 RepID=A0A1G2T3I7_9BACT|nr:MAG: hypothetical protein A2758_02885 [Candidatus Zambryskibacteria bacterium RIFCSPHIGHO2_01_FULL_49_18]OHB05020.1 MAG: hypothetical protein A3A26_00380 [Candidatus Zambryskibacteria bacterium RIFCSPLOWO2_01_FULL_47_14]